VAAADPTGSEALQGLRGNLVINSRTSEFDLKSNTVVYLGSVRVEATNLQLLCEHLTSVLPTQGGRIERVVARTNVVIDLTDEKGQKLHATGEQAVYSYTVSTGQTNETIELTGNPMLDNPQGTLAGDVITYDLITGKVRATNQRMIVNQDKPGLTNAPPPIAPATNAAPVSTNLPAEATPP
jgi:lipopolysaccharide transport protein LptA